MINFNNTNQHIYFIGIGGISMSGLAEILKSKGFKISGSDMQKSNLTEHLENLDIKVFEGHLASNITDDINLIVYTAAIKNDNPELVTAREKNIKCIERAELLGEMMKNYKKSIAISGTHGKTTTTSMISHILLEASTDPTISVGGILPIINGNTRIGHSQTFITEACEYCDSFLKFFPHVGIILNIDADHMDYFKDLNQIYDSFHKFATQIDKDGLLVINRDIYDIEKIVANLDCNVVTFGQNNNADYYAENVIFDELGLPTFDIIYKSKLLYTVKLNVPGIHNVYNALSVIAGSEFLGINKESIIGGLINFNGTKRRFEKKGLFNDILIIDDYAHHPTEIKATLEATKKYKKNKVWCIFQPHTYTRTKAFLSDFADALSNADNVILTDIYAAREKDNGQVHSMDIFNIIKQHKKDVYYISDFKEIENFLIENCSPSDIIITMGAGDVYKIGENLLKRSL